MAKAFEPQIVTANDLLLGDVIYRTEAGGWTREHREAAVAHTKEAAEALLKAAEADHLTIVGAYLAPTRLGDDGRPEPTHFREIFRTTGPTFRTDLGKQAEGKSLDEEAA
ncbi:MAG: DUF2849 domain-containing protein [Neomegalonema sp.]|nr:DUF2849 domain-containing protein [Neomegalonema sp.]